MNACDISLYGIIDPTRTRGRPMGDLVKAACDGGMTLLQYRDKLADTRTMIENGRNILSALQGYNVPLLINDRVDVAMAVGASGVHVGQSDMHPSDARSILGPDAIIGLTIKSQENAKAAPVDEIDYACIGGVYATLSKDNRSSIGLDGWAAIASHFRTHMPQLPVGAIAGIDDTNLADVLSVGADGAAIISAIFMADDVEAATRSLKRIIEDHQ